MVTDLKDKHNISMLSFLHGSSFIFQYFSYSRVRLKAVEVDVKMLGIWTGMKISNIVILLPS